MVLNSAQINKADDYYFLGEPAYYGSSCFFQRLFDKINLQIKGKVRRNIYDYHTCSLDITTGTNLYYGMSKIRSAWNFDNQRYLDNKITTTSYHKEFFRDTIPLAKLNVSNCIFPAAFPGIKYCPYDKYFQFQLYMLDLLYPDQFFISQIFLQYYEPPNENLISITKLTKFVQNALFFFRAVYSNAILEKIEDIQQAGFKPLVLSQEDYEEFDLNTVYTRAPSYTNNLVDQILRWYENNPGRIQDYELEQTIEDYGNLNYFCDLYKANRKELNPIYDLNKYERLINSINMYVIDPKLANNGSKQASWIFPSLDTSDNCLGVALRLWFKFPNGKIIPWFFPLMVNTDQPVMVPAANLQLINDDSELEYIEDTDLSVSFYSLEDDFSDNESDSTQSTDHPAPLGCTRRLRKD
jgi:hypothetical protein